MSLELEKVAVHLAGEPPLPLVADMSFRLEEGGTLGIVGESGSGKSLLALAILIEAGLSYLGLGLPPPTPSWGRMLNDAQTFLDAAPWLAVAPGVAIALAVLGFNLLGDGLRDLFDPRREGRR